MTAGYGCCDIPRAAQQPGTGRPQRGADARYFGAAGRRCRPASRDPLRCARGFRAPRQRPAMDQGRANRRGPHGKQRRRPAQQCSYRHDQGQRHVRSGRALHGLRADSGGRRGRGRRSEFPVLRPLPRLGVREGRLYLNTELPRHLGHPQLPEDLAGVVVAHPISAVFPRRIFRAPVHADRKHDQRVRDPNPIRHQRIPQQRVESQPRPTGVDRHPAAVQRQHLHRLENPDLCGTDQPVPGHQPVIREDRANGIVRDSHHRHHPPLRRGRPGRSVAPRNAAARPVGQPHTGHLCRDRQRPQPD